MRRAQQSSNFSTHPNHLSMQIWKLVPIFNLFYLHITIYCIPERISNYSISYWSRIVIFVYTIIHENHCSSHCICCSCRHHLDPSLSWCYRGYDLSVMLRATELLGGLVLRDWSLLLQTWHLLWIMYSM